MGCCHRHVSGCWHEGPMVDGCCGRPTSRGVGRWRRDEEPLEEYLDDLEAELREVRRLLEDRRAAAPHRPRP